MTTDRYIIEVPTFPGFYESWLSDELDALEAQDAECYAAAEADIFDTDRYIADPALRLSIADYSELMFKLADYRKGYDKTARAYVDAFAYALSTVVDFEVKLEFESLTSPREYNFGTDRLFAYLDANTAAKLHARALSDPGMLATVLENTFTSYDGFHSHYSPKLEEWTGLSPAELDHNGWMVFLTAAIGKDMPLLRMELEEAIFGDGGLQWAWEACIDWNGFSAAVEEERALKLEELRVYDPYYEPAYRCPVTPDLFSVAA